MAYLIFCILFLIAGYFTYARFVEKTFGSDPGGAVPAREMADGVDYVPLPAWKAFCIQVLNIAGLGPIFGPILGALYGPAALFWIVIGTIFAGAVHDYYSGMLSFRNKGASLPEVIGKFMGMPAKMVMRVISMVLMILVGVVFILGPANLLGSLTGLNVQLFVGCIFGYYFLASFLPVDKIIGRVYPFLGLLLLFMTVGIAAGMAFSDMHILPSIDPIQNTHPGHLPIWPMLFITLACGAISGFHSTQSPIMARCIVNEKKGRLVFYGGMIAEGTIALVWATAGMSFYQSPEALYQVIQAGTPSLVVDQVCRSLLGPVGGLLAILGVIVLPITSGDTAFRSTRLILAETFRLNQARPFNRLLLLIPLFLTAYIISTQDFQIIWRYFGWTNQFLAMMVLWAAAIFLACSGRIHWMASLPAAFMTAVCISFIAQADIGFNLSAEFANILGVVTSLGCLFALVRYANVAGKTLTRKISDQPGPHQS